MRKRVYKFTCADYGISNLEKKRLKLSTIADLNDPFDLCPIDTSNPAVSSAVNALSLLFWKETGILCFSRNWDNLLLWSHYGASHTGVCFGFDISEGDPGANFDTDVLYQPGLLQIRFPQDVNFDLANRMMRTKHESWSYEQEVRMFAGLDDPPDAQGLHWIDFGPSLALREVIIGAQCHPAVGKKVSKALEPYGDTVKCWCAGMRTDAFLLVKQAHPPYWHAKVR
jgi:hypothetical protein